MALTIFGRADPVFACVTHITLRDGVVNEAEEGVPRERGSCGRRERQGCGKRWVYMQSIGGDRVEQTCIRNASQIVPIRSSPPKRNRESGSPRRLRPLTLTLRLVDGLSRDVSSRTKSYR